MECCVQHNKYTHILALQDGQELGHKMYKYGLRGGVEETEPDSSENCIVKG